jgi:hypothetical protein
LPVGASPGATKQPHAPVLLCPLRISPRSQTQEDFDLELRGPIEPNLVLAYFLRHQHGVVLDESTLLWPDETGAFGKLAQVQGTLESAEGRLTDFRVDDALVLGFFSYEKLPIVRDLRASAAVLAAHPVIAAIAGLPGRGRRWLPHPPEPQVQDRTPSRRVRSTWSWTPTHT